MLFSLLNSNLERETFYLLVYFLFMIAWCCSATCGGDVVYRVVLTGRFASALCELSPNLQTCMCPQGADVQSATTTARLDVDVGAVLTSLGSYVDSDSACSSLCENIQIWIQTVKQMHTVGGHIPFAVWQMGRHLLSCCSGWAWLTWLSRPRRFVLGDSAWFEVGLNLEKKIKQFLVIVSTWWNFSQNHL